MATRRHNTGMSDEDAALLARLARDPVLFGESALANRDQSPRRYWPHQIEDLLCPSPNIIHLDGRDVGKTIALTTDCLHYALSTPGGLGLIAAPHDSHLSTIIEEIEFQLAESAMVRASVAMTSQGKPKVQRKPYYRVEFTNASVLYFRPAGPYGDAFRSLHVNRVWVDEGAWLTEPAWKALRQTLKAGGRMRIYSTPNGIRNTTYYRLTHSQGWKQVRWPSWLNPDWSDARRDELLEFYGGTDTAGWQHEVCGEHGKPSYGAFNQEQLDAACQDVPEFRRVNISGDELAGCQTNDDMYDVLEAALNLTPLTGTYWIGGDLGYTNDPTELVVFRESSDLKPVCSLVLRVHCERVSYPIISMIVALLERYYSPTAIGVDNGGNGGAVVQELLTLDAYRGLALAARLRGFDFGGMTSLPTPDGGEVRKRTKELMTSIINGMLQRRELRFPSEDLDLLDQFTTHTYTMTGNGIVYSKGNDHIVDAVRCAVLARELKSSAYDDTCTGYVLPVLTAPVFNW